MKVLSIAAAVLLGLAVALLLLGLLPLGVHWAFGPKENRLCLRVGPLRIQLNGKKKKGKPKEKNQKKKQETPKKEEKKPKKPGFRPTFEELLDLIERLLNALGRTVRRACRRLRLDPFTLTVVFASPDPVRTAMTYGAAEAAMWTLMPQAEELFRIPDPSLRLRVDFAGRETRAEGEIGASLRLCDLAAIALTALLPLLRWWLSARRRRKAERRAVSSKAADERKTAEKIA